MYDMCIMYRMCMYVYLSLVLSLPPLVLVVQYVVYFVLHYAVLQRLTPPLCYDNIAINRRIPATVTYWTITSE